MLAQLLLKDKSKEDKQLIVKCRLDPFLIKQKGVINNYVITINQKIVAISLCGIGFLMVPLCTRQRGCPNDL
jgi:hypothetical protein